MGKKPASHQRAILKELGELLEPKAGSGIQECGHSLAQRLAEDEELLAEVRKRFEAGRLEGRFPVLSALLAEASGEDIDQFFRSGWVLMAVPLPEATSLKPWDLAPWEGNLEAYREDLYAGMSFGMPDLRAFAREWIEELLRVGYYGMEEALGLPLKQQADDFFSPTRPLPLYGEAYPTRLGDIGQTVWLRLDGPRSPERGYREISVSDEPLRTDAAILAALTALEARPLNLGTLRKVLRKILPLRGESFWDRWTRALEDRRLRTDLREALRDLQHHQALDYVLTLLRYHRPGFDDLPPEERADLVTETCAHTNEFLEALRKLVSFLEHGRPNRRGPAATKVAARDVRAAVLKDVDGLTNRQIGEDLCVPLPADFMVKGDHPTVRKMVARGRKVLERALGEDGWRAQAEAMRAQAARWTSMSEIQCHAELEAEALGVACEEAMRRLKEGCRPSGFGDERAREDELAL